MLYYPICTYMYRYVYVYLYVPVCIVYPICTYTTLHAAPITSEQLGNALLIQRLKVQVKHDHVIVVNVSACSA